MEQNFVQIRSLVQKLSAVHTDAVLIQNIFNYTILDIQQLKKQPIAVCICISTSYIWALTRENLSSEVCEQQRRRPACASAQTDQRLCYSLIRKYYM